VSRSAAVSLVDVIFADVKPLTRELVNSVEVNSV